jgi:hypothetical protein
VAASLLVTAVDAELPRMLVGAFKRVTFTTAERLGAVLAVKPGPMVLLLDESQVGLVADLRRNDVRAVVLVRTQRVPVVFRHPVVAVLERPLVASQIISALQQALADVSPSPDRS